jgi:hypothetical protein
LSERQGALGRTETLVYESDWLASRPLFYNVRNGRASHAINDVIDLADIEFDPEGFNDYLDFGYCVFERTPLRDVRMLRFSSRLLSGPEGLRVEYLDDPAWGWLERRSTVDEVLQLASAKINECAAGDGDIVVPTSGGLDSRFINVLLTDRRRLRAFTYGVSDDPASSAEAVKAAELARRLACDGTSSHSARSIRTSTTGTPCSAWRSTRTACTRSSSTAGSGRGSRGTASWCPARVETGSRASTGSSGASRRFASQPTRTRCSATPT